MVVMSQGRVNALGFSSELLAFRDSPVPLASAMTLATRAAPQAAAAAAAQGKDAYALYDPYKGTEG